VPPLLLLQSAEKPQLMLLHPVAMPLLLLHQSIVFVSVAACCSASNIAAMVCLKLINYY
jgi:hypothetical protein